MARANGSYPLGRWFEPTRRYHFGPLVKRLRHRPFTAVTRVQISYGSPYGSIAQLGEHLPYKQRVIGSSPIVPTTSERTLLRSDFCLQKSERGNMPLLILIRKRSHSRRLFGCKRPHNAFGSLPSFRGRAVQKPLPARTGAVGAGSCSQTKAPKACFRLEACQLYRHAQKAVPPLRLLINNFCNSVAEAQNSAFYKVFINRRFRVKLGVFFLQIYTCIEFIRAVKCVFYAKAAIFARH